MFADRNNMPYDQKQKYNAQPEGIIEEESSPFPDIPFKLPVNDLAVHQVGITTIEKPDKQAEVMIQARRAAENVGLMPEDFPELGSHLIEPKEDEEEPGGNSSISEMQDDGPAMKPKVMDVDNDSIEIGGLMMISYMKMNQNQKFGELQ